MTESLLLEAKAEEAKNPRRFPSLWRHLWLIGALGMLLYLMWPTFAIPFGIIDDHEIIHMIGDGQRVPMGDVVGTALQGASEPIGRFRPAYWVGRTLESATAGTHAAWWYLDRFLLASGTLLIIYIASVRFVAPVHAALISLLPFMGPQFEVWYRLGPNEAYAVPLFVLGVAMLSRGLIRGHSAADLWPAYLALVTSGLAKENFALPAVIIIAWSGFRNGPSRLGRNDWLVLAGALLAAVVDLAMVRLKVHTYGGVYSQPRDAHTAWEWFAAAITSTATYLFLIVPLLLAVALFWSGTRLRVTRPALEILVVVAMVLATQVAFYAGAPVLGRYLYPFCLAGVLAWGLVAALCTVQRTKRRRAMFTATVAIALTLPIFAGVYIGRATAERRAGEGREFVAELLAVERTAQSAGIATVLLQPEVPATDYEPVLSLSRYLTVRTGLQVMTLPASHVPPDPFNSRLAAELRAWSTRGRDSLRPYQQRHRCMSLMFGNDEPLCATSMPAPG